MFGNHQNQTFRHGQYKCWNWKLNGYFNHRVHASEERMTEYNVNLNKPPESSTGEGGDEKAQKFMEVRVKRLTRV